jgi:hypothetical protein
MLGFEHVGDYDTESDETGMGAEVMKMGHTLCGECCNFFGWDPGNLKFHYEDPATSHACPGSNMIKAEYIDDVRVYMGDGGDAEQPALPVRRGTVHDLVAGDVLNIRASSSSSSIIIGTAENGDELAIVGEGWNGNTRWLRVQFGRAEGADVAIFGWCSAQYVQIAGDVPVADMWRENITATEFGGGSDEQDSAYPDIDWITEDTYGIALPLKWKTTPRPQVEVQGPNGSTVTVDIVDLGPWNTNDPSYVNQGQRPLAEKQYKNRIPAQNGQVPTNDAGIDLTARVANAVGISGKGKVRWRFAP